MPAQPLPAAPERLIHLLFATALFGAAYTLTNHLAEQQAVTRSAALAWEAGLPFLPWMVLPYMTSGLLFALSFLLAPTRPALIALSWRVAFATVCACLIFAAWPLRFSLPRPAVEAALPAWLFARLGQMDLPYNQFPSLHVAYCAIFWPALSSLMPGGDAPGSRVARLARFARHAQLTQVALAAWLLLVALSTLFTYQHHVLDVIGGAALGALALRLLPQHQPAVQRVAVCYVLLAGLALLAWFARPGFGWLYLCASLLLVALAYLRGDSAFLGKRDGVHPWRIWLLYAPYLAGYWLTWQLVRWRERNAAPFLLHDSGLWIGRRLTPAEAAQLPPGCAVIDLCNELSETPALRRQPYRHFPLLDLQAPDMRTAQPLLAAMADYASQGRDIYLHCAMGYRRSREIAQLYQEYRLQ